MPGLVLSGPRLWSGDTDGSSCHMHAAAANLYHGANFAARQDAAVTTNRVHAFADDVLADHDAVALAGLIQRREISAVEAAKAAIARAGKVNGVINAIELATFEAALRNWLGMWSLRTAHTRAEPHLARIDCPALVINADADTGVFPSDARRIHDALASADKTLRSIDADHYFTTPGARDEQADTIAEWIATWSPTPWP